MNIFSQKGGTLLITMVIFGMFLVLMVAAVNYVSLQYKGGAQDEIEDQSFEISDSGVEYLLWLLNSKTVTPQSLVSADNNIVDPATQSVLGSFANATTVDGDVGSEILTFVSTGTVPGLSNECRRVKGEIKPEPQSNGDVVYYLTKWYSPTSCAVDN